MRLKEPLKSVILSHYSRQRKHFQDLLQHGKVDLIVCPAQGAVAQSGIVNFSLDLIDLSVEYTKDEYAQHISATMALVEHEKNFHLTLLPASPFRDIQIAVLGDAVSVLRWNKPYAAFVFLNSTLTGSVSDYFSMLIRDYAADRHTMLEKLDSLRCAQCENAGLS